MSPGGHVGPGMYPGGYPAGPPPRTGGSKGLVAILAVVVLAASVFGGALASGWRPIDMEPDRGTFEAGAILPGEGTIPSPGPDSTLQERIDYFEEQAELRLEAHGESLVSGSLEGWLAAFDPTLHSSMSGRYETLQAMDVSQFDYRITSGPHEDTSGPVETYDVSVAVSYCFVVPAGECIPTDTAMETVWSETDAGFVIIEMKESDHSPRGPHPWEADDLVAATGERTVVALPSHMEEHLDFTLQEAESAAALVDQYAVWEPVERYVLYVAGDDEFDRWFGGDMGDNVVGYALGLDGTYQGTLQETTMPTVVAVDRTGWGEEFISTVRHELAHVATLHRADSTRNYQETWWMVEGIAEYIDYEGPVGNYPRLQDVSGFVNDGGCSSDIPPPSNSDSALAGSGSYGCAFLAVTYMVDEYGQDDFLQWFGESVREGKSPSRSAEDIYGKSSSELMEEITRYIQETV
ncbi:hypothetical protein [Natronoglycomyces albus]|uniref:Peptidase MA-like domain-containing protein n=1 Tax=Natronoglycomyces albus TaxID=2811108 RepID=A0A895XR17_9ACTN|nr:hypothetical protein [Natronoglycomyces albus]QSB05809.1 hypothetical protein JQS30_02445 [Natronoglycomyces albus]